MVHLDRRFNSTAIFSALSHGHLSNASSNAEIARQKKRKREERRERGRRGRDKKDTNYTPRHVDTSHAWYKAHAAKEDG